MDLTSIKLLAKIRHAFQAGKIVIEIIHKQVQEDWKHKTYLFWLKQSEARNQ